jgi:putative transposase
MSRSYKIVDPEGIYFITFATVEWIDVFTRPKYKDLLIESLKYCIEKKSLIVYSYVIMTNHIHLIASSDGPDLSGIIRDFKKFTSKAMIKALQDPLESRKDWMLRIFSDAGKSNSNNEYYQFWRQDNHPIELYSNEVIDQKIDYIHNNPVEEGIVDNPEDYIYSSARDYAGTKGILDIVLLD